MRNLDGRMAIILAENTANRTVSIRVGDEKRIISHDQWMRLPLWDDGSPEDQELPATEA